MTNTQINETRYTIGLNMKCNRVVTKCTLLYVHELDVDGRFDCVIQTAHGRCKANTNELYATRAEALAHIND